MGAVTSLVMQKGPTRFDMAGQVVGRPLRDTDEKISQVLCTRLHSYAADRLRESGFGLIVDAGWDVEVWTMDADEKPADRTYGVTWRNADGGEVSVVGIFLDSRTRRPFLDHGLAIEG